METGDRGTGGPADRLQVAVVSPEAILFEGVAASVVVPAFDGLVGILPRHAPFLALLGTGLLSVRAPEGERRFTVTGGFVQVRDNVVRVVAESARVAEAAAAA